MPRTTIRSEDITDLQVKTADVATGEITTAKMAVDPTNASNLSSGAVPLAQLGNAPATDVTGLQNDIATLALQQATQNNQSAYNLANAFVDQYEDSTGIDATSDTARAAGEYMASIEAAYGVDASLSLLLHMDGANDGTVFTDSSSNALTVTATSNAHTDTALKKFGTASLQLNGTSDYISTPSNAVLNFGTGAWTVDAWVAVTNAAQTYVPWYDSRSSAGGEGGMTLHYIGNIATRYRWHTFQDTPDPANDVVFSKADSLPNDTNVFHHVCFVRTGNNITAFVDGVAGTPTSVANFDEDNARVRYFGTNQHNGQTEFLAGYIDELRVCKGTDQTLNPLDPLYISSGTDFTPPTKAYAAETVNASGFYTSTNQTAAGTVSKMNIVVLYKNESGTATLDTDLVAQVSANGGTNYTAAPLTAAGTFSTGILIAKSNDITISNTGTAPKYKISFANQSVGSKETRVYGVALLY